MQMETEIIKIEDVAGQREQQALALAGELIRQGELVAFPTETVYGLGANALDAAGVAKIFAAKGRPADNPLISHVATLADAEKLVQITPLGRKLAEQFWPGPMTLVLPRRRVVPDIVTAGLDTAAVRFPVHPVALALIRAAERPIAAPSANTSGRPSPTQACHVYEDIHGKLPLILDGGAATIGLESTVVNACGEIPVLLRPGGVTAEQLRQLCGQLAFPKAGDAARPAAPGMKYTHYAPKGRVQLAKNGVALEALRLQLLAEGRPEPLKIVFDDTAAAFPEGDRFIIARRGDLVTFARNIFAAFRLADQEQRLDVLVETVEEAGLGLAIMNRMRKAAGLSGKQ